jgi:hypothetical protein
MCYPGRKAEEMIYETSLACHVALYQDAIVAAMRLSSVIS